MGKSADEVKERLDSTFFAKRICRAEIYTKDSRIFISDEYEPREEAHKYISIRTIVDVANKK